MHYYTVWVRSQAFHGKAPLTYEHDSPLHIGAIVLVPLQRESVLGFVTGRVTKPAFITKAILKAYELPPLPPQLVSLAGWIQAFYATNIGVVGQQLLPVSISDKTIGEVQPVVSKPFMLPVTSLSLEQNSVVNKLTTADTYLLHGRTGSGKTRVYVEQAAESLKNGKSVIILTPEISLTSQLAATFRAAFHDQVVVLHSQLTPVQHQKVWLQILTATVPIVVIGPRSALFSPIKSLGLIVVDESHETSYKQEQAPYYHALRVASQLASLHTAQLILGSATPSIADYFMAEQRHKPIFRMEKVAQPSDHPDTDFTVVDLKDRGQFTRSQYLSTPLVMALQAAIGRGEQSLIYLNRRGTARIVICENCGWQAVCPHCDLPLTYHADSNRFQCHTCGHHEPLVTSCPACGHPSISFKSFGTKAILSELERLLPEARIQRFDTDNKQSERFERHYESVRAGDVDILVGTQLLAKGLDLPKLSTVGIVLADSSLALPDFSSQERTYQLLTQVLGRVGRGHVQGHAIIQTYHPDNAILEAAITDNWDEFYATELAERKRFHFPPFYHLLKLSCRRATAKSAEAAAVKLKALLIEKLPDITVDGPAPSYHEKIQSKFQYQLVVKSTNRSQLISVIELLPASGWTYDIDPINLL